MADGTRRSFGPERFRFRETHQPQVSEDNGYLLLSSVMRKLIPETKRDGALVGGLHQLNGGLQQALMVSTLLGLVLGEWVVLCQLYQQTNLGFTVNLQIEPLRCYCGVCLLQGRKSNMWMEKSGMDELVVQMDQALDLSAMESCVKLVGKVINDKPLNKWGVRNILRTAWKEFGRVDIQWVHENIFIFVVQDESMAVRILDQSPWAVMKKILSVKKWPPELALEKIEMNVVLFGSSCGGFLCAMPHRTI